MHRLTIGARGLHVRGLLSVTRGIVITVRLGAVTWSSSRGAIVTWGSWGTSWVLARGRGVARRVAGAIVAGAIRAITRWRASRVRGPGPVSRGRSSWPRHPHAGVTRGRLARLTWRGPTLGGGAGAIAGGAGVLASSRLGRAIARVLTSWPRAVVTPGIIGAWASIARPLLVSGVSVTIARLTRGARGSVTFVHVRGRAHVGLAGPWAVSWLGRAGGGH